MEMGIEKEIALLAIKRVGTDFGALGFDGLNKALDMCGKIMKEKEEEMMDYEEIDFYTFEDMISKKNKYTRLDQESREWQWDLLEKKMKDTSNSTPFELK